jgi:hypothetical protein
VTTYQLPQVEGQLTPAEAQAWLDALNDAPNYANTEDLSTRALKFTQNVISEWADYMRPLHRRWRATYHMLSGNTLERGGPEDVHVPKIYQQMETMIPRIEEAILEREPWHRFIPRQQKDKATADTVSAYMDFLFDQGGVSGTIQPAARDMLVTQIAYWYTQWRYEEKTQRVRTEKREWKNGVMKRSVSIEAKKVVTFVGVDYTLGDPFDFVMDPKYTDPQKSPYVGHRVWLTVDEIKKLGKQFGWANVDDEQLKKVVGAKSAYDTSYYSYTRDPTSMSSADQGQSKYTDGRPGKIEVLLIYAKFDLFGNYEYDDYQMVVSAGQLVHEVRRNQYDGGLRPYALARASKNGHGLFGVGPFDNAIRLNQHLDRYHQIFLRSAEVAACPMVFAQDDSDLPDSLYKVRPFSVFKGVGPVTFSTVPNGVLQAAPMVLGSLSRTIEDTTGVYPIQMGQDVTGGTATEATLSLQEGNRRLRGYIRGFADGLTQLLRCTYLLARQYSQEDEEFPVLGKRALDLRRTHLTVNPADLLAEGKFEIVGLRSLRQYGLTAVGVQNFMNAGAPLMMANPAAVDQVYALHVLAEEHMGTDVADRMIRMPTPPERLRSQEEENEGLITGAEIEVDPDDNHREHLRDPNLRALYERASDPDDELEKGVKIAVLKHWFDHQQRAREQQVKEGALQQRMEQQRQIAAPEAGGQPGEGGKSSPMRGGMSDAMTSLPGQQDGETPGPPSASKSPRPGGTRRPVSQSDNAPKV